MPFIRINETVTRGRARAQDFDILRNQMDSLLTFAAAQSTLAEENTQLRGLLSLRNREPSRFVATTIIRSGTSGAENVFQVDAGSEAGVLRFGPVMTEVGLLGQIQEVYSHRALGFDWSHREFRVSAMTVDGRIHGLVQSQPGTFREQDRMVLRGTAYLSELEVGTELVTSGRGGTYPRGIRIGWVSEVAETLAGWSHSYYVDPAVYPGQVTHALVGAGPIRSFPFEPEEPSR